MVQNGVGRARKAPKVARRRPGLWRRARLRFRRLNRWVRIGIFAGAGTIAFALLFMALISSSLVSNFVTPRIIQAIEARLGPGYLVKIRESKVDATIDGLDLKLDGFEILDQSGTPVFGVPSASLALDGDLLTGGGDFSLRRIKLVEPQLVLRIEQNGTVALAAADGSPPLFSLPSSDAPQAAPAEILGFLAAGGAILQPGGPFESFEIAEIVKGNIVIDDQRRGRVDRLDRVDLRVVRRADSGLVASLTSTTPTDRWSVSATLLGKPGEPRDFDVGFENLPLGRIIYEAMRGQMESEIDGRLFGHLYAKLDQSGAMPVAEARIDLTNFRFRSPLHPEAATNIERGRVVVDWNAQEKRLRLQQSDVFAGNARISLGGQAKPLDDAAGTWEFSIGGTELPVPGADVSNQALRFDRLEFSGTVEPAARKLTLSTAGARGPALMLAGYGSFDFAGEKPFGDFALASSRAPIVALLRAWPAPLAANTRKWLAENVKAGMVDELTLAVRGPLGIGPQPDRMIRLDARFDGTVLDYLEGAPPAVDVSGTVHMEDQHLEVLLDNGRVDIVPERSLSIVGTRFFAADHRPNPFPGELAIKLNGSAASASAFLAVPRLAQMAPGAARLLDGAGKVDSTVYLRGPYGRGSDLSKLVLSVDADLTGLSLAKAVGGKDLEAGNLHVQIEPATANLRGQARLAGAPVAFEAIIAREPGGAFGQTSVAFSLDPSKMKNFSSEALQIAGPVSARLSLPKAGAIENAAFEADLSGSAVEGPLGLRKAAGQPGQVSFTVASDGDLWRLRNFQAQGSGIDVKGTLSLGGAGFASADFSSFNVRAGDDIKLKVNRSGNVYKVSMQGSSFDAREALGDAFSGETKKGPLDVDLDAKFGTVLGNNGQTLAGADFRISRRDNVTRSFYLAGRLGDGPIEGRSGGENGRVVSLRAADGGAMFRFLDIYRQMRGGQLELDIVPGKVNAGRLRIRGFQVIGDQQLASVAHGNQQQIAARGMTFTKLESQFKMGDGRIHIDDFVVYGNDLGATLSGDINYAQDQVSIRGTFLPAYALNNLFGKVPILGAILGGGSQEGLVGITFEIEGPWTRPQMKVNPLSAVAPGFLRKIFEFRDSSNPPAGVAQQPGQR